MYVTNNSYIIQLLFYFLRIYVFIVKMLHFFIKTINIFYVRFFKVFYRKRSCISIVIECRLYGVWWLRDGSVVVPVHAVQAGAVRRCARRAAGAGAGGARPSGVQRAPRTPAPAAPQCRAGARHARPAPLPRRLTAWPPRPPPPHAATL